MAFEDEGPGGGLALTLEIQARGPDGSIRPRPLWMALASGLRQLGHSHGVQRHRHQTIHRRNRSEISERRIRLGVGMLLDRV